MNYIDSVKITGFWGAKNVEIKFSQDINFLIGPNGSGKTTIINLISAALRADMPALYNTQFEKISIKLKSIHSSRKPVIEIMKNYDSAMGSYDIKYLVKDKSGAQAEVFGVEGPFEERIYRDPRSFRSRRVHEVGAKLTAIMRNFVEVNWISVHRGSLDRPSRYMKEEEFDTSVDQRVNEIAKKFASYFSLLANRASEESKSFQEAVFLSLLEQENAAQIWSSQSPSPDEKENVVGVLKDLGVSNAKAHRSVAGHYGRLDQALKKLQEKVGLSLDEAVTLSDSMRIKRTISRWRELNMKREEIYKPRHLFEKIINELFSGKELHFDERNNPVIHLKNKTSVPIDALSSGEKQLFIILGEALLQEDRPVVFISDEPELSLHVSWQSSLFRNVRRLNTSCQIISATHSPDIVGEFQMNVIRIEECFTDV